MLKCLYDVDTGVSAMNTHVQRWGNSLAVRIPKAFAEEAGLQANDEIEITVRDGQIVLTLSGINPSNCLNLPCKGTNSR